MFCLLKVLYQRVKESSNSLLFYFLGRNDHPTITRKIKSQKSEVPIYIPTFIHHLFNILSLDTILKIIGSQYKAGKQFTIKEK